MRISVTGIDGVGKSTAIKMLEKRLCNFDVVNIKFPNYNVPSDNYFSKLVSDLYILQLEGDRLNDPTVAAASSFLNTSLYGQVLKSLTKDKNPEFVLSERDPIVDSIVYYGYYQPFIRDEVKTGELKEFITEDIQSYASRFSAKMGFDSSFTNLPAQLKKLCNLSFNEKVSFLKKACETDTPDHLILLHANVSVANQRIDKRFKDEGDSYVKKQRHLHETSEGLSFLNQSYFDTLAKLKDYNVHVSDLDTSDMSSEQVGEALMQKIECVVK